MQVRAHDHPLKAGARRIVRQLFGFWLGAALALSLIDHSAWHGGAFLVVLWFGLPIGVILWALYRLVRFAIG